MNVTFEQCYFENDIINAKKLIDETDCKCVDILHFANVGHNKIIDFLQKCDLSLDRLNTLFEKTCLSYLSYCPGTINYEIMIKSFLSVGATFNEKIAHHICEKYNVFDDTRIKFIFQNGFDFNIKLNLTLKFKKSTDVFNILQYITLKFIMISEMEKFEDDFEDFYSNLEYYGTTKYEQSQINYINFVKLLTQFGFSVHDNLNYWGTNSKIIDIIVRAKSYYFAPFILDNIESGNIDKNYMVDDEYVYDSLYKIYMYYDPYDQNNVIKRLNKVCEKNFIYHAM